jgi:hypothetical protein
MDLEDSKLFIVSSWRKSGFRIQYYYFIVKEVELDST